MSISAKPSEEDNKENDSLNETEWSVEQSIALSCEVDDESQEKAGFFNDRDTDLESISDCLVIDLDRATESEIEDGVNETTDENNKIEREKQSDVEDKRAKLKDQNIEEVTKVQESITKRQDLKDNSVSSSVDRCMVQTCTGKYDRVYVVRGYFLFTIYIL